MSIGCRLWRQSQGFIFQARFCNHKGFSSSVWTYLVRGAKQLHSEELLKEQKYQPKTGKKMSAEGESSVTKDEDDTSGKRPQFGNRYLENPDNVFQHNAWDNVAWDPEQLEAAKRKVDENSKQQVDPDKKESYETEADSYWDKFYSQHQNKFFKDRHWLFTEFPELSSDNLQKTGRESCSDQETPGKESSHGDGVISKTESSPVDQISQSGSTACTSAQGQSVDVKVNETEKRVDINQADSEHSSVSPRTNSNESTQGETPQANLVDFPGKSAFKRILEVGCGVGNTIFPILQTNADPRLFVYGCDFSSVAVDIVRQHSEYVPTRCHAFVCDVSDPAATFPFPDNSLDLIVLIFVMSAINPDRFLSTIQSLTRLLKPGGRILFRDYGRYDMAQLRFKKGRCLSDNFYVRGDGTRVYFFTQDELRELFTSAGLEEEQNVIDRRLQVNRGRQLTMYRVWIQCKYRKP